VNLFICLFDYKGIEIKATELIWFYTHTSRAKSAVTFITFLQVVSCFFRILPKVKTFSAVTCIKVLQVVSCFFHLLPEVKTFMRCNIKKT